MRSAASREDLAAAYERTNYGEVGISLEQALNHPVRRAALELGARLLKAPRRVRIDFKRLAAGDRDD